MAPIHHHFEMLGWSEQQVTISFWFIGFICGIIDCGDDPHVLINPVIIETAGEQRGYEGCLSVPGKTGVVTRPDYAKVKAYDEDMNEFILEGEGLLARAICHECEHLDGHMYVEKVEGELEDVAPYDEEE